MFFVTYIWLLTIKIITVILQKSEPVLIVMGFSVGYNVFNTKKLKGKTDGRHRFKETEQSRAS